MKLPFLRPKIEHLDLYLTKKSYDKALAAIDAELAKEPNDLLLLRRKADILELTGDVAGAAGALRELAQIHVRDGFHTRAIAAYNRILEIDPESQDVMAELAGLIDRDGAEASREKLMALDDTACGFLSISAKAPASEAKPTPDPAPTSTSTANSTVPIELPPPSASQGPLFKELAASALFTLFEGEALEKILSSTYVRKYQEGDIIVTEGEEGASLFLLVDGEVKVFTRGKLGQHLPLAKLGPGDLFGEVSVLYGKPRTATITAKTATTAIEVKKQDIDRISEDHPQVREVLESFCEERAKDAVEALIRSVGSTTSVGKS